MIQLIKEENEFFIDWIKKIWKHHNTVDLLYQCDLNTKIVFEENEFYFKIMRDQTMVGFVGLKLNEDIILKSQTLYINRLYIDDEYRNQGIGTEVINLLITMAKSMNRDLELDVYGNNEAIHLYEKMGFKINYRNMILKTK